MEASACDRPHHQFSVFCCDWEDVLWRSMVVMMMVKSSVYLVDATIFASCGGTDLSLSLGGRQLTEVSSTAFFM